MSLYSSAGVYTNIVDASLYVSNAGQHTTAMLLVTEKGPINEPIIIFDFNQFVTVFGSYGIEGRIDAFMIKKFFEEGGNRLIVVGIAHYTDITDDSTLTALKSSLTLKDRKIGVDKTQNDIILAEANSPKTWGDKISVTTQKYSIITTINLTTGDTELVLNSSNDVEIGDKITISDGTHSYTTVITSKDNGLNKIYFPAYNGADTIVAGASVSSSSTHRALTVIDNDESLKSDDTTLTLNSVAGINIGSIITVLDKRTTNPNFVSFVVKGINNRTVTFDSVGSITEILAENSKVVSQEFQMITYYESEFRNYLKYLSPLASNKTDGISMMMSNSKYDINSSIITNAADPLDRIPEAVNKTYLSGGSDGVSSLSTSDYIGDPSTKTGLYALDAMDDIDIICAVGVPRIGNTPGSIDPDLQNAIINYSKNNKTTTRCIVDPPSGLTPQQVRDYRYGEGGFGNEIPFASEKGSLHYPWEKENHPITGETIYLPPACLIAGRHARSYTMSYPHRAPAGPNRTIVTTKGFETKVSRSEDDFLSLANINVTRSFSEGAYINGQRTLSNVTSGLDSINVVDCVHYIVRRLEKVQQAIKFEPNDSDTWKRVVKIVQPFLKQVKDERGLYYYDVTCGPTQNTGQSIDNKELYCLIVIQPTKAAEKIINTLVIESTQTYSFI